MKKKRIIIIIIAVILVALAIFGYSIFSDMKQEEKLREEINSVADLMDELPIDTDKTNRKLDNLVTSKGDYQKLEGACKDYLRQIINDEMDLYNILEDDGLTKILTANNYQQDGPDFVKTTAYISEIKLKLEDSKKKFQNDLKEDTALSFVVDKNLDDYYVDLYKKIMLDEDISEASIEIEKSINEVIKLLNVGEEIIEFLKSNKGSWQIENGNILFTTDELINEYNNLLAKIQ